MRFSKSFFNQPTLTVARRLLGAQLVTVIRGRESSGTIIEVEAYHQSEPASHSHRGVTSRNQVMFGPPGRAYVYFIYGMHYCVNVVTEEEGVGAAVLIRALVPDQGEKIMVRRRGGVTGRQLCNGPGKLTQALGIDLSFQGENLITSQQLFLERGSRARKGEIVTTERIGISKAQELPWRFLLR